MYLTSQFKIIKLSKFFYIYIQWFNSKVGGNWEYFQRHHQRKDLMEVKLQFAEAVVYLYYKISKLLKRIVF